MHRSDRRPTPARRAFVLVALIAATAGTGHAQLRRIPAALAPIATSERVPAGGEVRVALSVQLPDGFHVQSNAPRDPSLIATELAIDAPAGVTIEEVVFPKTTDLTLDGYDQPLAVFGRVFTIGVRFRVGASVPTGALVMPARLRYQACDDKVCYAPNSATASWTFTVVPAGTAVTTAHADILDGIAWGSGHAPDTATAPAATATAPAAPAPLDGAGALAALDRFTIQGTTGGYLNVADFTQFVTDAERGTTRKGLFEGRGPLAILLIVFVGGLALNLTPCVLPMIPINLAIIGAGAQAGSRARGFLLGATYGGAMAIAYGVLGLVVILTAGTFGTLNASPWFNLGIAILFVVLGLAMFDVILIDFSKYSSGFRADTGRGSLTLAFTMGAVAALLAGACVAPVIIQVVLFSSNLYAAGTKVALALPFLLGVGMALPWPIAGAGLASLPKPGKWMVAVKQAFGVLIIGTAVYYGYLAYELFSSRWVEAGAVSASVEEKLKEGWHASLAEGLAVAEREQKPVLIDLWATWCKNCLTMDKTTFEDASVKAALAGFVKIKVQAEQPDEEPALSIMKRFNAVGLPTYVILRPRAANARPSVDGVTDASIGR